MDGWLGREAKSWVKLHGDGDDLDIVLTQRHCVRGHSMVQEEVVAAGVKQGRKSLQLGALDWIGFDFDVVSSD